MIRNTIATAVSFAESESRSRNADVVEVTLRHFKNVAVVSREFDKYLKATQGGLNDTDIASLHQERTDDFQATIGSPVIAKKKVSFQAKSKEKGKGIRVGRRERELSDYNETDESETDESETDESETDESETEESSDTKAKAKRRQRKGKGT